MARTWMHSLHVNKGKTIAQTLSDRTEYVKNPIKTNEGEYVSAYECNPETADAEFLASKYLYEAQTSQRRDRGKHDVIAYHITQSFRPGEITPEEANVVGYQLAMSFTKGKHAFIVATHIDKSHIHSHIVFNSTTLDCTHKFKDFFLSARALRRISDILCLEHGLSIIKNPKPKKGKHYGDWLGDEKKPSWQQKLRQKIDEVLPNCKSFDDFIATMKVEGYEVKTKGKHITMTAPGQKRPSRLDTLRGDYTQAAIRERLGGQRIIVSSPEQVEKSEKETEKQPVPVIPSQVNLLINIQSKIQQGKGVGYENWAKGFNLKELAKTLMFLQDNGLTDYEDLKKATAAATTDFSEISQSIKVIDKRLSEINELQKNIGTYGKTRDVYAAYRASGYSKKYRAEHESDIILHQAAKKYFDSVGLKKLPTVKALQTEFSQLTSEKKKLYARYHDSKGRMRALVNAKSNAERILRIPERPRRKENVL